MEVFVNSLVITILGIGFVFIFLLIQVALTNAVAKFAAKYSYLLPEPEKPTRKGSAAKPKNTGDEDEIVAVITAAVQAHNTR